MVKDVSQAGLSEVEHSDPRQRLDSDPICDGLVSEIILPRLMTQNGILKLGLGLDSLTTANDST